MISLYFHFPFCRKKCPYCHFFVIPNRDQDPFLKALLQEWELRLPLIESSEILSIYFGGGTPSLSLEGVKAILSRVTAKEITVEINPEDGTLTTLQTLKELGVNRISIGAQSFSPMLLKHLGRAHTAKETIQTVEHAKKVGIDNISIDLIYELPYQTLSEWKETIQIAAALPITHLSLYNLTIEPHTLFKKQEKVLRPHMPSEEEGLAMLEAACTHFEEHGLKRYEISAFARDEAHSLHNIGYWKYRNFLGFGPSAFSYLDGNRFRNVCHLGRYIKLLSQKSLPVDFEERLPFPASLHEKIAIGLRMMEGLTLLELPQETKEKLSFLETKGWVKSSGSHFALTEKGRLFYDSVAEELIDV